MLSTGPLIRIHISTPARVLLLFVSRVFLLQHLFGSTVAVSDATSGHLAQDD